MLKTDGQVANTVDADQMLHSAASDLGLQCLLRHVCPNIMGSDSTEVSRDFFSDFSK